VNRLPPEVLSRIIRHVPHEHDTNAQVALVLTHVCRYWREFIISTPWEWALISSGSEGLAALSLKRAKAELLEICLDMRQVGKSPQYSDLINPYIQRAKILHFSGFETVEGLTKMFPNFPQSMPNLQSLTLDRCNYSDSSVDPFESLTPTLRHLKLLYVPLYPSFLRLRDITELYIRDRYCSLHLDTILDFLEENRSLKSATLGIVFTEPSLHSSRRGAAIANQLQYLSIPYGDEPGGKSLISNISLQRGAHLEICAGDDLLSYLPTAHLLNLSSPTFMEYRAYERTIRLLGPNGSLSFHKPRIYHGDRPFVEFPLLPLTDIRELRLIHRMSESPWATFGAEFYISFFPALEIFATDYEEQLCYSLPTLFSDPSFPPSLKTLAFLNCDLSGGFMEELTRFASGRRNTTSALLRRVVIIDSKGNLPSVASINALEEYVPVVDVCIGKTLPKDLS